VKKKFQYLDTDAPIAFAHRGGAFDAPENSMAAFQSAVNIGYRYLETDVHLTSDGKVIAFHDHVLDRVTNMSGKIAEMPYSLIQNALIAEQSPIPLLEELLEAFPEARFNIDPKDDRVVGPLSEIIASTDSADRICVASFSDKRTREVSRLVGKRLCTGVGPSGVTRLRLGKLPLRLTRISGECVQVPLTVAGVPLITPLFVQRVHSVGKVIHAWTINDEEKMHHLIDIGVDGIMTDKPNLLKSVLTEHGLWY